MGHFPQIQKGRLRNCVGQEHGRNQGQGRALQGVQMNYHAAVLLLHVAQAVTCPVWWALTRGKG